MLLTTILQFTVYGQAIEEQTNSWLDTITTWLPIFIFVLEITVVTILLLWLIRKILKYTMALKNYLRLTTILVTLPKESGALDENQQKVTPQIIQEQIGVAEVLWSAFGGLHTPRGLSRLSAWLIGRHDHMSLEIAVSGGVISFYLIVPQNLKNFVEQQVQAHYPHAMMEEISGYNIFAPRGVALGVRVKFSRSWFFPLKTYKQFETDPLNSITNALSKIPAGDGAAIQFIIRSAPKSWRSGGVKLASTMKQGKSLHEASGIGATIKILNKVGDSLPGTKSSADQKMPEKYQLSPLEEEMIKGIEQKASKAGLEMCCRIVTSAQNKNTAKMYLENISNSFGQYNVYQYGNSFKIKNPISQSRFISQFIKRSFSERKRMVVNAEELASLFHFPLPTTETPNIRWMAARRAPSPTNLPNEGVILGKSIYRNVEKLVRLKTDDRRRHVYIIGKSGTGKSVLIQNMIIQDIQEGKGVCLVDPHGDLVEAVLGHIPATRAEDVIVFDPSDAERPIGLNMLEAETESEKDFAAQEMIAIFYKLVSDPSMIGPMFEHYMRNAMLTIMANPKEPGTIVEIPRILTDKEYQTYKLQSISDPIIRAFWEKELPQTSGQTKGEMLPYLVSKIGRFIENQLMRNIIGQAKSGFNFSQVMNEGKILLVNLSKGKIGEMNSNLLGLIIVSKLQMAAMRRAELPENERRDFYLYIDEFQNFITDSISTILSEARKYRLDLTFAHQYLGQLVQNGNDTKIKDAVLGTTGTMICFKVGVEDAEVMAKEFAPVFSSFDVINIEQYNAYVKLLIDNAPSRPFNIQTLPPTPANAELSQKIKLLSRLKYGRPIMEIEQEIFERSKLTDDDSSSTLESVR